MEKNKSRIRLLLLERSERLLDGVVGGRLALEVVLDERDLLGDGVGDRLERLLDRVLGEVPLELGHVREAVDLKFEDTLDQFNSKPT